MDSYNRKEFETMQQEAIRRVREMHKQAQSYVDVPPENDITSEKVHQNNFSKSKQNNFNSRNNSSSQKEKVPQHNLHTNNMSQSNHTQPQMYGGTSPNYQNMSTGNPFSQLFGSNLGAFAKFKNMFKSGNPLQSNTDDNNCDKKESPINGLLNGMLKDFDIDEEKIILGALIYLLYKNGTDAKLLLALGYLIL